MTITGWTILVFFVLLNLKLARWIKEGPTKPSPETIGSISDLQHYKRLVLFCQKKEASKQKHLDDMLLFLQGKYNSNIPKADLAYFKARAEQKEEKLKGIAKINERREAIKLKAEAKRKSYVALRPGDHVQDLI